MRVDQSFVGKPGWARRSLAGSGVGRDIETVVSVVVMKIDLIVSLVGEKRRKMVMGMCQCLSMTTS